MSRGILSELPNGLKVATRAMPQVQSLSVGIWVKAGARDERDSETGIAHMRNIWLSRAQSGVRRAISPPKWKMSAAT